MHRGKHEVWEEFWCWVQSGAPGESWRTLQEPGLGVMSFQVGETGPSLSASASKVPIPALSVLGSARTAQSSAACRGPPEVLQIYCPSPGSNLTISLSWGRKPLPRVGNLSSMPRPPSCAALHPWEPRGIGMAQPSRRVPGQSIPDTSDLGIRIATERTRKRWEVVMETATNWISTRCKEQFV